MAKVHIVVVSPDCEESFILGAYTTKGKAVKAILTQLTIAGLGDNHTEKDIKKALLDEHAYFDDGNREYKICTEKVI